MMRFRLCIFGRTPRSDAVFPLHPIRGHIILICPIAADIHLTKVVATRLLHYSYSFPFAINTRVDIFLPIQFSLTAIYWARAR